MNAAAGAAVLQLLDRPGVRTLLALLSQQGHSARLVGGAIRNTLMGLPASDIDIAATLLPEAVMRIAGEAGWKAIPTGIEHGTVTVRVAGEAFEVTTLREDIETDGRRARVRFGQDFERDAARRDFTMNALSLGPDGVIHDYFGGLADITARRVRFIGAPAERLREDYLRALRFLRFSASYGAGGLEPAGLAAVLAQRSGLAGLSGERVRQEVIKLLQARHGAAVIAAAEMPHGLLSGVIGLPLAPERLARFVALSSEAGVPPLQPMALLFALGVRQPGDIAVLKERLRLANREETELLGLAEAQSLLEAGIGPAELVYRQPAAALPAQLLLLADRGTAVPEGLVSTFAGLARSMPHFQIGGDDLQARGFSPGPVLGAVLRAVEARWVAAGFPPSRADQLALLEAELAARG